MGEKSKRAMEHKKGSKESVIHRESKEGLVRFLNEGGTVCVILECQACGNSENRVVGREGGRVTFVSEYPFLCHGERRADIGVVLSSDRDLDLREGRLDKPTGPLQWAIEIFYTSRTEEKARESIPWFEFWALDVREALIGSRGRTDSCLYLRDKRDRKCNNGWCNNQLRYARELGYFVPAARYGNEGTRLLRAAMTGKCESRGYWTLKPRTKLHYKECKLLWKEFLAYGVCIRCHGITGGLARSRPFCSSCYQIIGQETKAKSGLAPTIITEEQKEALRNSFAWLDTIPNVWSPLNNGTPCLSCYHNHITQPFYRNSTQALGYVWYFGRKIPICEACLPIVYNNPSHPLRVLSRTPSVHSSSSHSTLLLT